MMMIPEIITDNLQRQIKRIDRAEVSTNGLERVTIPIEHARAIVRIGEIETSKRRKEGDS